MSCLFQAIQQARRSYNPSEFTHVGSRKDAHFGLRLTRMQMYQSNSFNMHTSGLGWFPRMVFFPVFCWYPSSVSQRECQDLAEFVREVLGPYSSNVTAAAQLCSASLCQGKGRCVRQNPDSSAYLHLPSTAEGKVRKFHFGFISSHSSWGELGQAPADAFTMKRKNWWSGWTCGWVSI